MKKIFIDPKTVRKTPDAGRDFTYTPSQVEMLFEIKGALPVEIEDDDRIAVSAVSEGCVSGIIAHPDIIPVLQKIKGCKIVINNHHEKIFHKPIPEYYFSYKKTLLHCSECKSDVLASEIISDELDDVLIDICPVCKKIDTFEDRIYQTLEEYFQNTDKSE